MEPALGLAKRERAVVVGAGVAGLATARVLHDHYREVLVLDRDTFSERPDHRRYLPQSHHAHGLLGSGRHALTQLFPGWADDLQRAGARGGAGEPELAEKFSYFLRGDALVKTPAWWTGGVCASRVLIEHTLRARVQALPSVSLHANTRVTGLRASADKQRVLGVTTDSGWLEADLVVDTTGRQSQLPSWFEQLGFAAPPQSAVHSNVQYASCLLEPSADFDPEWFMILGGVSGARGYRGVVVLPIENRLLHCTFGSIAELDPLPGEECAYRDYARAHLPPVISELLAHARLVTPIRSYHVRSNRRLHYERAKQLPRGVLALGDAVCAFNPLYGQGMTVAARSAIALGSLLSREHKGATVGFERRAAAAVAAQVESAWELSVGEDLRLGCASEGVGKRPFAGLRRGYQERLERAAAHDPELALALIEVLHLQRPASDLLAPRLVRRVLWPRPRPSAPPPATTPRRARSSTIALHSPSV